MGERYNIVLLTEAIYSVHVKYLMSCCRCSASTAEIPYVASILGLLDSQIQCKESKISS